ncbi:MAG: cellulase family glycosylhydrolase [Armatimonadaceae bacterium]
MPWTVEQAQEWHNRYYPIYGCNYLPRTAVNSTEMWQEATFDLPTIVEELTWAADAGYNAIRVFLPFLVWEADSDGFYHRLEALLNVAEERGIGMMPILFDDCAFAGREPSLGPQSDPVPGVHNSGWTPSPGHSLVKDISQWHRLEGYVRGVVGKFGGDARITIWDLYNEPGNGVPMEESLPLVEAAFRWAQAEAPHQPLTVGAWREFDSDSSRRLYELSDLVSFHAYGSPDAVQALCQRLRAYNRPLLCTEWLHRPNGNTFDAIVPIFREFEVGWYHWGLVAGRTQTYMPWGSKVGDPEPALWQHDVFHSSGMAYDPREMALLRQSYEQAI